MRAAALLAAVSILGTLPGCGGAAKPVVLRQHDAAPAAKTDKTRGAETERSDLRDPAPRDRGDEGEEELDVARDEDPRRTVDKKASVTRERDEAIVDQGPAPAAVDPAPGPSEDYLDPPTVAEATGGGGLEGDTWEESAPDPRDEVQDLEDSIRDEIEDYTSDHGVKSHAHRGSATCAEVCDLSRAICKSSSRICTISASHPGDGWISGRCSWSKDECRKSEERCTVCNP